MGLTRGGKSRPVVGLQDTDPAVVVVGVILPGLCLHLGPAAQEGCTDLRHHPVLAMGLDPLPPRGGSVPKASSDGHAGLQPDPPGQHARSTEGDGMNHTEA
jgi:hypothetical protein